jgi:GNAT superfamily N-acetyltransferase
MTNAATRPTADELIAAEIAKQDRMWGAENDRADASKGQLFDAACAQMAALRWRQGGDAGAFDTVPSFFPEDWGGFRDYGSDIANLVVAAAYIRQEIARKLRAGECFERLARTAAQPYNTACVPNPES